MQRLSRRTTHARPTNLLSDAMLLFNLSDRPTKSQIKARYYELAKLHHPDANHATDSDVTSRRADFLMVQAAFESLMLEADQRSEGAAATSAQNASRGAARGRPIRTRARRTSARERTLGEVLCEGCEPEAVESVWRDVLERKLVVSAAMTNDLFKACAGGGGAALALRILREASDHDLMTAEVRTASIVSLLSWCKEEELSDSTFAVVAEIRDEDRTPEVLAALSSTFSYFPSGASF